MKKFTIKLPIIILFMLLISQLNCAEPQTKAGDKSIFFYLNGLSDLSIDNTFLAGQYLFADGMGVWAGISLGMITDKPNKDIDAEKTDNYFEFSGGFIQYIYQKGPIGIYLSPQVGFFTNSVEDKTSSEVTKESGNGFHIAVSVGAEWWFTDNVSLIVATPIGFATESTTKETGNTKEESSSSIFGFLIESSSRFTISFYF